ncbi:MAG: hypothetical protein ACPGJS_01445 [Flammeovirgaceae bacterium]
MVTITLSGKIKAANIEEIWAETLEINPFVCIRPDFSMNNYNYGGNLKN